MLMLKNACSSFQKETPYSPSCLLHRHPSAAASPDARGSHSPGPDPHRGVSPPLPGTKGDRSGRKPASDSSYIQGL